MKRILIVEDELSILKIIEYELRQNGYDVDIAMDGEVGYELAKVGNYDLIILDLMMPKINGIDVCKHLRADGISSFIMMVTALGEEDDKVTGLDIGADDYMTKPFSTRELISRVKALLRRTNKKKIRASNLLRYRDITINKDTFEVFHDETKLDFTVKEFELLVYLVIHVGKGLSRDELLSELWGYGYDGGTRIVDVHIFKLREKLKTLGKCIKSIRGVGYMLEE